MKTQPDCSDFYARVGELIEINIGSRAFSYIDKADAEVVVAVAVGQQGWVAVVGEPACGDYEWVRQPDAPKVKLQHSDVGYSSAAEAMRDGLKAALD